MKSRGSLGQFPWIAAALSALSLFGGESSLSTDRIPELVQRVRSACLAPDRVYQPVFIGLDSMNHVSDFMTALMIETGIQEGYVDRSASPRFATGSLQTRLQDFRQEVQSYAAQRGLNEFQKACVAQCVGYQWFKDTPENSATAGSLEYGIGNCRHSTYLAEYMSEALGLSFEIVDNGISEIFQGIGHTFSRLEIEGRSFVMNNNLASDSQSRLCAFRFSRTWERIGSAAVFLGGIPGILKAIHARGIRSLYPTQGDQPPIRAVHAVAGRVFCLKHPDLRGCGCTEVKRDPLQRGRFYPLIVQDQAHQIRI